LAIDLFVKDHFHESDCSGIVIAGFGTSEIFPALIPMYFEGVVGDWVRMRRRPVTSVDLDQVATIVPFAQREMVYTFMEGVNPDYEEAVESDLLQLFRELPELVIDNIPELNQKRKDKLKRDVRRAGERVHERFSAGLQDYRRQRFVLPVVRVVSMAPKDELAVMAETLVNLTSFKRKVSLEAETVGGPIDVAVISKVHGLVWVKRKHYFELKENPHVLARYFE
jgi:hypothetical protein